MLPIIRKKKAGRRRILLSGVAAVPAALAAAAGSRTNQAAGSATRIISTPSARMAPRHPNEVVSQPASSGTSAPPTPIPRYAMPMARPRALSNQRESSTWFGSGPPRT
jgi:hypothetical protein